MAKSVPTTYPLPAAKENTLIYQWFDSVADSDIGTLEQLHHEGLAPDCLHPLHQTTALMEATRLGRTAIVSWLLARGATPALLCGIPKGTALHCALRRRHWAIIDLLLNHMQSAAIVDAYGATPLHALCLEPHKEKDSPKLLEYATLLIGKHCPIDALDHDGTTALHHTVMNDATDIAELLLGHGANANALIPDSWVSPLIMAALEQNREMAQLLLCHGADPHLRTRDGQSAAVLYPAFFN